MVDPSHTFGHPLYSKNKKDRDLMRYDLKGERQKDTRFLAHKRRETVDIGSKNVIRLPELRDWHGEKYDPDPVTRYYATKRENKKYFRLSDAEKVDIATYSKANHLISPSAVVGVSNFKSSQAYLSDKAGRVLSEPRPMKKSRYTDEPRDTTVEKYKAIKQLINNERKA